MKTTRAILMTMAGSAFLVQFASAQILTPQRAQQRIDHDERTEGRGRFTGQGLTDFNIEAVHVRLDRYGDFRITLYGDRRQTEVLEGEWDGRNNRFSLDVDRGLGERDINGTGTLILNSRGEAESLSIRGDRGRNNNYSVSFRFEDRDDRWNNRGGGGLLGGDRNNGPWYQRPGQFYDLNDNQPGEGRFRGDGLVDFDVWSISLRLSRQGSFSLTVFDRNRRSATVYGEWEQEGRNGVIKLDVDQGLGERDIAGQGRIWLDRNNRVDRVDISGDRGNRRDYSITFRRDDRRRF